MILLGVIYSIEKASVLISKLHSNENYHIFDLIKCLRKIMSLYLDSVKIVYIYQQQFSRRSSSSAIKQMFFDFEKVPEKVGVSYND